MADPRDNLATFLQVDLFSFNVRRIGDGGFPWGLTWTYAKAVTWTLASLTSKCQRHRAVGNCQSGEAGRSSIGAPDSFQGLGGRRRANEKGYRDRPE